MIDLRVRPLPVRLWRTYCNYRLALGRWDSLFAACWLQWMNCRRGRR